MGGEGVCEEEDEVKLPSCSTATTELVGKQYSAARDNRLQLYKRLVR